jgi:hypothetical protein
MLEVLTGKFNGGSQFLPRMDEEFPAADGAPGCVSFSADRTNRQRTFEAGEIVRSLPKRRKLQARSVTQKSQTSS